MNCIRYCIIVTFPDRLGIVLCLWESGSSDSTWCRGGEMFGDRIDSGVVSLYQAVKWHADFRDHTPQEVLVGVS